MSAAPEARNVPKPFGPVTPSADRPSIPRTPSPLTVKYSTPNPFQMRDDPPEPFAETEAADYERPRLRELRLYQHALKCKAGSAS